MVSSCFASHPSNLNHQTPKSPNQTEAVTARSLSVVSVTFSARRRPIRGVQLQLQRRAFLSGSFYQCFTDIQARSMQLEHR